MWNYLIKGWANIITNPISLFMPAFVTRLVFFGQWQTSIKVWYPALLFNLASFVSPPMLDLPLSRCDKKCYSKENEKKESEDERCRQREEWNSNERRWAGTSHYWASPSLLSSSPPAVIMSRLVSSHPPIFQPSCPTLLYRAWISLWFNFSCFCPRQQGRSSQEGWETSREMCERRNTFSPSVV